MTKSTGKRVGIATPDAPGAIGPYSQAVRYGDALYCSGALPIDPGTGDLVQDSLAAETRQCLENLEAVCQAAGTSLAQALRLTVYTTRLEGFAEINEAYARAFDATPPARVTIGVAALPRDARVEIDAIVAVG
ncbi:MAG TPA: Rid family detoxifying hydrolase [Solirubrobacteraceae bacterium]